MVVKNNFKSYIMNNPMQSPQRRNNTEEIINIESFTRINNDVNGNPRYVIHFLDLLNTAENNKISSIANKYKYSVRKANKIGGKKYTAKNYGGGIVFQSYNLPGLVNKCNELLNTNI